MLDVYRVNFIGVNCYQTIRVAIRPKQSPRSKGCPGNKLICEPYSRNQTVCPFCITKCLVYLEEITTVLVPTLDSRVQHVRYSQSLFNASWIQLFLKHVFKIKAIVVLIRIIMRLNLHDWFIATPKRLVRMLPLAYKYRRKKTKLKTFVFNSMI